MCIYGKYVCDGYEFWFPAREKQNENLLHRRRRRCLLFWRWSETKKKIITRIKKSGSKQQRASTFYRLYVQIWLLSRNDQSNHRIMERTKKWNGATFQVHHLRQWKKKSETAFVLACFLSSIAFVLQTTQRAKEKYSLCLTKKMENSFFSSGKLLFRLIALYFGMKNAYKSSWWTWCSSAIITDIDRRKTHCFVRRRMQNVSSSSTIPFLNWLKRTNEWMIWRWAQKINFHYVHFIRFCAVS